jgi:hypothetical protein
MNLPEASVVPVLLFSLCKYLIGIQFLYKANAIYQFGDKVAHVVDIHKSKL